LGKFENFGKNVRGGKWSGVSKLDLWEFVDFFEFFFLKFFFEKNLKILGKMRAVENGAGWMSWICGNL
jgi:hypothetical protein